MASLIALISLIVCIVFIVCSRGNGHSWPMAMLTGVNRSLQAMLATAGLLFMLIVGIGTTRSILHPVAEAAIALFPEGQPATSHARRVPTLSPTGIPEVATLPRSTSTPHADVARISQSYVMVIPTSIPRETVMSPQGTPTPPPTPSPTPIPATPAPEPLREECDPAYPDARTCIPPGPPFDQGCAITAERRFTVLPPDPQGLDHDNDGIGCEPVA
jgi:hypothetical protein